METNDGTTLTDKGKKPRRVLLVEDNLINQKVATAILRKLECEVFIADNGAIALEILKQTPVQLILMDCQMPVMDGLEATRRIRLLPPPVCDLPIVAVTAGAAGADRQSCFAVGMNGFLPKPITFDMIQRTLLEFLPDSDL